MIKTAAQILAEIGDEDEDATVVQINRLTWTYPKNRRKPGDPPVACKNAYRGCEGLVGVRVAGAPKPHTARCGHGYCSGCYQRWRRHGDSWYHSPRVDMCTKPNCFMGPHRKKVDDGEDA